MKQFFAHILISLSLILAPVVGQSQEASKRNDYRFYKKHGHAKRSWNKYVKEGFAAYDRQDCQQSTAFLKEAVRRQAQDALVYFKLAVCTELLESPYTAVQYYELAQEKLQLLKGVHPYQQAIFENYGRALFSGKKTRPSPPLFEKSQPSGHAKFQSILYARNSLSAKK